MFHFRDRVLIATFHLITISLAALHLYVWRFPPTATAIPEEGSAESRWWGLWPVTYLPNWAVGVGIGVILLLIFGSWIHLHWSKANPQGASVGQQFLEMQRGSAALLILISLVLISSFFLFPIVHTRWGDAYILAKGIAHPDPAVRLTHSWQAPLDVYLHSQIWHLFHEDLEWRDAMPVYRLLSPLAGVLYLGATVMMARTLPHMPTWITLAFLTSVGVMQLFFGYIENYSFAAAGIVWYLWFGLRTLTGGQPLWHAALILGLVNAFHPSTIVYAPSLLYCGWRQIFLSSRGQCNNSWVTIVVQIIMPMAVVAGATITFMEWGGHGVGALMTSDRPGGGDARWLVPIWETTTRWERYTFLSWPHLRDIINEQLLVAPIIIPLLALAFLIHVIERFSSRWSITRTKMPDTRAKSTFLTIATTCHLLLIWLWNPDYGGQRDWDLFSLAAIPTTALVIHLLPRLFATQRSLIAGVIPMLVLQYWHLVAWIYQNTLPWEWP